MSKIISLPFFIATLALLVSSVSFAQSTAQDNYKKGLEFLTQNSQAEGVQTTPSGLQYLVLKKGTGSTHPGPTDRVKVHYHGTLINGNVFDSSVDRGQSISFGLNRVIKGWTEGLQLMVVGEKTRLFIPSNLAYGKRGAGSLIGPDMTLIFDVELLGINQ
ncbi:MAG: FKBP-type peptidyl-prolyl cis-trans isomerase [Thiotrichaceae bacterium]|nr:FKBP-type peptidyl-prolyl cis-trans isomerase [Thiotrichaceae bacterium]